MTYRPYLKRWLLDPRTPPVTPHAKDEEWNDHAGMSGVTNGLDASWSAFGVALTSATYKGSAVLRLNSGVASGPNLSGYAKTQPSTPYTITCEVSLNPKLGSNLTQAGIGFRDHLSGKLWLAVWYQDFPVNTDEFRRIGSSTQRRANPTSITSSGAGYIVALPRQVWMQATNDGSNLSWAWSVTGVAGTYETITTESYATALMTPTQFVIWIDPVSVGQELSAVFGPVRVT